MNKLSGSGGGKGFVSDRSKNIVIFGIVEPAKESPADLYKTIEELTNAMGIPDLDFDDAYRLGKPGNSAKGPRPVLLRLMKTRDKRTVFNNKKKLQTTPPGPFEKVYIHEDQSVEERKIAKSDLRRKLKELKQADQQLTGSIRHNTLFTRKDGNIQHKFK